MIDSYRTTYDKIAKVHVEHWRSTGLNPFQDKRAIRENEQETLRLVHRFAEDGPVLDAGCGIGDFMLRLPGRECKGVDIAQVYLEAAAERGLDVTWALVEDLPFEDEGFATVLATDVLEHVLDLNAAVQELLRVLRPGGVLITRVPNMDPPGWDPSYGFVHLRILDEGTMRALFEVVFGCEVLELYVKGNSIHCAARKC